MNFTVAMEVFWAIKNSELDASLTGIWYYKDLYQPSSVEQKMKITSDIKSNKCVILSISGNFSQICDLLLLSNKFAAGGSYEIKQFSDLVERLENISGESVIFDNISNLKGTSLGLRAVCSIENSIDDINDQIKSRHVIIDISKNWSFRREFN